MNAKRGVRAARRARYLALRREGLPVLDAAQVVGIERRTAYAYEAGTSGLPGRSRRVADIEDAVLKHLAEHPGESFNAPELARAAGDLGAKYMLALHMQKLALAGRVELVEIRRPDGSVASRRYRSARTAVAE